MTLEEVTLALFTACNSMRIVAYVPHIVKAAADKSGASSISMTTWLLFLIAHLSTVAYALVNRSDWGLAAAFAGNAACSVAILGIAFWKRRSYAVCFAAASCSAESLASRSLTLATDGRVPSRPM